MIDLIPLGGANSIGSSCYLLKIDEVNVLIDCGLKIAQFLVFDNPIQNLLKEIGHLTNLHGVFVTHAHLDHMGALPILVANGYNGMFYGTSITKELTYISLCDFYKKYYYQQDSKTFEIQKHNIDYIRAFWEPVDYYHKRQIYNFQVTPLISGHLIGGCSFLIEAGSKQILFSGDVSLNPLSQMSYPLIEDCDYFICDGTGLKIEGKIQDLSEAEELLVLLNSSKPVLINNYVLGKDIFYLLKIKEIIERYGLHKQIIVTTYTQRLLSIYEKQYPIRFNDIKFSDRFSNESDTIWIGNYNVDPERVNIIDRLIHYHNHLNQSQLLFLIKEILKPSKTFFVHTNSTKVPTIFENCYLIYENLHYALEG